MIPYSSFQHQLILFLLALCSLNTTSFASSSSNGLTEDSHQLLSFRSSLPEPNQLNNWLPTINPCDFTGLSCESSRISSVELAGIQLRVDFHSVSTFLMTLQGLRTLVLKNANLSGSISFPERSQCSSSLSYLDLSGNTIFGSIHDISRFSACPSLKFLNLSGNSLEYNVKGSDNSEGLPISLRVLDLSHNKISGDKVVPFLLSSGCSELESLSLKGNCRVNGSVPLFDCKKLEYLDLSANDFTSELPSFGHCQSLHHLDLSSNGFFGDISASVSSCGSLSFLNLTGNRFSGAIPELPGGNLRFLYLSENGFQGVMPAHLSDLCSSLVELDLSNNHLYGEVPESIVTCSLLELLDISYNNFSGALPIDTLLELGKLKSLVLSFNNFHGYLPESLSNLSNLVTLDVSSNNLSGSIPSGICQGSMKGLQVLYLQNNKFTGLVPESLGNCSELVLLDLSFNYLKGTIPSSLGSLSKLRDLVVFFNQLRGVIPRELMYTQTLEKLILDFNYFSGSIPADLSNCTSLNWISLSNNQLSGGIPATFGQLANLAILKLGNNSLGGNIPTELGDCGNLIWLDLNTNKFSGAIPSALFKQSGKITLSWITIRSYVYIKNDGSIKECHGAGNLLEFEGIRVEQLGRISSRSPCNFTRVYKKMTQPFDHNGSMLFLDLSHNRLEGSIPKEMGSMSYLSILNLAHNDLSGPIPQEFEGLRSIGVLDLSHNKLDGSIPQSLTSLTLLTEIDLSNNNLSGMIPQSAPLDTFSNSSFLNNSCLCGYPLLRCGGNLNAKSKWHDKSHSRRASLAGSVALSLLFSLFCVIGLIMVAIEAKKRRRRMDASLDSAYPDSRSHSATVSNWKLGTKMDLGITLTTFDKPLEKLTFTDLFEATNGFHRDTLVGSGGFGDVYRAQLKDGHVVAIKKLRNVSGQADREFTAEMETIGKIKNRHLVPLLGYCKVGEERLLVYEFMKNGSLEDVLHHRKNNAGTELNWEIRKKIAMGAARGLAFLHHSCTPYIIHRDMKSSNVLLDENLEGRVSDFGMARLVNVMETHLSVSTLAGTPGYVPPEYYQSFRCSTQGDVYSYGVVVLELLTGRQSTNSAEFGDNNLVGWVKQHAKGRVTDVFDTMLLRDECPGVKMELLQFLEVACACLDDRPWRRPTMIQVIANFLKIQAGSRSSLGSAAATAANGGGFTAVNGGGSSVLETGLSKR